MAVDEATLRLWGQGPSDTEKKMCENAERVVKDALNDAGVLDKYETGVFAQGSYRNSTNIPQESDVDICACCTSTFFTRLPDGCTERGHHGIVDSATKYSDFKNDVGKALSDRFGPSGCTRADKVFEVHENSYRIDAEVLPCFEYRYYTDDKQPDRYLSGIQFTSDSGKVRQNWPDFHIRNGIDKNNATGTKFKRLTRIVKRLGYELRDAKKIADLLPSYLVECSVYNVPNEGFGHESFRSDLRAVLAEIFNQTLVAGDSKEKWWEVNGFQLLFHPRQS